MPGGLQGRFSVLVGAFVIAVGLSSALSFLGVRALDESARNTGLGKDAVADIVPPPLNLLEPYLLTFELAAQSDEARRNTMVGQLRQLERGFHERDAVWRKQFAADRDMLARLEAHARSAKDFFREVEEQFLPALAASDLTRAARVRGEVLDPQFQSNAASAIALTQAMNAYAEQQAAAFRHEKAAVLRNTLLSLVFSVAIAVAFVGSLAGMSRAMRTVSQELRGSSSEVAAASGHVSSTAQALSQGAVSQAASIEETSASMEEMASMTRQNAENSAEAAKLMAEANEAVERSNVVLGEMVSSMEAIRASSDKVSRIIKTIDEIAFQTNILALNAAVEAARAGEAGMGFAVVADEVRSLAQRSASAARDTSVLIEEAIANSQQGAQRVAQVEQAIAGITTGVARVKELVEQVSIASREQSQGIDQVSQAIARMENVTQTTAASAEESAASSEELSAQAESALAAVSELEKVMFGAAMAAARSPWSSPRPPVAIARSTPKARSTSRKAA
ncbi:MAG: methyl-accepting chemotaxis protein [Candidatus Eisenbacteria bacterium]